MTTRVEALANPLVLAWARRMSGLEPELVAKKVGVKPARIQAWERGELRPTITQLRKLSDVYKRPLALFFLHVPPADDPTPTDFRRFDPEAAESLSPELRVQIRDVRAKREAALDLFQEIGDDVPSFELSAAVNDDPEAVAERLRRVLAADRQPPSGEARLVFNFWREVVERVGVLVFQADDVQVEEMRGFSVSERPLPAVALNIKDSYQARSFSLFHEVAHVMLNSGGLCILEEEGPRTNIQRTEVFCNHVAGAVLLPSAALLREPEVPARCVHDIPDDAVGFVARRYGTSREAVLRRLVILNRVSAACYRRKREEYTRSYQQRGRQRPAAGFAPPYTMAVATAGRLFSRLVLQAYDDERITSSDVAEYLGVRLKHLDRIRAAVRGEADAGGAA